MSRTAPAGVQVAVSTLDYRTLKSLLAWGSADTLRSMLCSTRATCNTHLATQTCQADQVAQSALIRKTGCNTTSPRLVAQHALATSCGYRMWHARGRV
jgi:hypothetical protein